MHIRLRRPLAENEPGCGDPPIIDGDDPELYIDHVRLHSALGYITPADRLGGRAAEIFAGRRHKLQEARLQRGITVLDWTVLVPLLKGGEVHGLVFVNADAREQGPVLKTNEPTATPGEIESKERPSVQAKPFAQPVAAAERAVEPADEAAAKEAGSLRRQIAIRADTFIRTHISRSGNQLCDRRPNRRPDV